MTRDARRPSALFALFALFALGWALPGLASCGATTATVPRGPQPVDAPSVPVPYPPPPAQIEVIPLRRRETCVWLDGAWDFRGGEWEWTKGAWVVEQDACYHAAGETRFESTPAGVTLVFRRSAWFDSTSGKPCAAPPPCASESAHLDSPAEALAQRSEPW